MPVEQYRQTVQDVIDSVFRQFGDESGAQVTQSDVIRWVNEAQRDVVVNNREVNQSIASFGVQAATSIYDIVQLVPNILRIHSIMYNNRLLPNLTFEEAQTKIKDQELEEKMGPQFWWKYAGYLNLWPAPAEDLETAITVYYTSSPVAVTQGSDVLGVPESYYEAVNAFCLAKAFELDGDSQMLGIKREEYNRNLVVNSLDTAPSQRDFPTIREVD